LRSDPFGRTTWTPPGDARARSTRENVAWYEKRGYHTVIEGIVPGTDVPVWGLIREPQSA